MYMPILQNTNLTACSMMHRSQLGQSKYAWQLRVKKHYCLSETKLDEQVQSTHIFCCIYMHAHIGNCILLRASWAMRHSSCLLNAGLPTAVVLDDELAKPARTVLAIGPGASIDIDSITSQLRLYDQLAEAE